MKNKFISATIFSTFLLCSPSVKASSFIDNQRVDSTKTWTIKFNHAIDFNDLTKQGITVTDSKNNIVKVGIQLGQDIKTITVTAPQCGYTIGENYTLNVGTKVHCDKGTPLKNEYKLHFNIRSADNITFKDKHLEGEVRALIGKWSGDIYKSDTENITEVCLLGVHDLSGIENLTNLKCIMANHDNEISDINSLKELTNLQELTLSNTEVSDINVLKGLTGLKKLNLEGNNITDISALKKLTNLQDLSLSTNKISDISSLKGLTNLQELGLINTSINDISALKRLTNLKELYLDNTEVTDIHSLKELTNLKVLDLEATQVSDISSLKGLTNLQRLYLQNTKVTDISVLKGLPNLQGLYLKVDQISDADIQSFKKAVPQCSIFYYQ